MTEEADEVILRFEPQSVSLLVKHRKDNNCYARAPRMLQFDVRPSRDFVSSSGGSFDAQEWTIALDEGETYNDNAEKLGAVGFLRGPYSADEVAFDRGLVTSAIGAKCFEAILAPVLAGRLPKEISITVKSPAVTWDPRTSRGAVWNIARDRSPPVLDVQVFAPLLVNEEAAAIEPKMENPSSAPASKGDIQALAQSIRDSLDASRNQFRSFAWAAVIILVALLLLRAKF